MPINNKGFTILEVLASIVIFAGAATVLVSAYVNILSNFEASRVKANFDEELAYIRSELLVISDPELAMDGDEFDMGDGTTGIWYSEFEMTEIPNLFSVNLFVDMVDEQGERVELNEQLYLLRPSWGEPDEVDRAREDLLERMTDNREDQQFGWDYKSL